MKKTIALLLSLFSIAFTKAQSQSCITVVSSYFENPSGDNVTWRLVINYTANGTKNLRTYVFRGSDTLVNACFQTSNQTQNGTLIYDNLITSGGNSTLRARFIRRTGTCDNGIVCGDDQIINDNVLDIKIANLSARNVRNNTEITFRVLSVDETQRIIFNFYMPNGELQKREVKLPYARDGETWKVTFDNIKKTYTTQKLN
jgi:hypothetical protein